MVETTKFLDWDIDMSLEQRYILLDIFDNGNKEKIPYIDMHPLVAQIMA